MMLRNIAASMASMALVLAQLAPVPAALAPIGMADAAARQLTQTISCNSRGNQPNTCRLPAGTISVSYVGPDRSGRCVQGRTWQQRGNGLWVTGGCGGNFEIVYDTANGGGNWGGSGGSGGGNWGGSGGSNQGFAGELTCRSIDNRQQTCRVNTGGRVQLLQQYSSTQCVQNRNWRYDRNSITVRDGCQARFGYGYGNNSGGGWGGSGGGNSNQGFAGELTCRSQDNRQQFCRANTQGRAQLLQQYSSARCIEGQSWFASNSGITVRNGCQARFGYGYGNNSGSGWGGGNNQGYAGQIECRSENNRYRRCPANTRNRATLVRQYSNTQCVQGRNWGWDNGAIWVDNGCQGRFAYGYGNVSGNYEGSSGGNSGGSNAGGIVAGGLLAAGLIAALAAAGKSDKTNASSQSGRNPASVDADWSLVPASARSEAEACMTEAARQIGATGGSRVKLKEVDTARQSGSGWMILADVTGTWDDHVQTMRMDCRASGGKVTAFDIQ